MFYETELTDARAHPRSRGENLLIELVMEFQVGSSPLTRGKQAHDCEDRGERGLIPAHAGKTRSRLPAGQS